MSENSNTTTAENAAEKTIEIYLPHAGVNEMLGVLGVPFPDAADIDHIIIHVDHSALINSPDLGA